MIFGVSLSAVPDVWSVVSSVHSEIIENLLVGNQSICLLGGENSLSRSIDTGLNLLPDRPVGVQLAALFGLCLDLEIFITHSAGCGGLLSGC